MVDERQTEEGDQRVTEEGDVRVLEFGQEERRIFRARDPQQLLLAGIDTEIFTFETLVKDAADTVPIRLEFGGTEGVAYYWKPDQDILEGMLKLPTVPNGFAAMCIQPGTTAGNEPRWPRTLDAEIDDGSAKWTMVAKGSNGTAVLTDPTHTITPSTPMQVNGLTSYSLTAFDADVAGGTNGQSFEALYAFKVNGKDRVARQLVICRKL